MSPTSEPCAPTRDEPSVATSRRDDAHSAQHQLVLKWSAVLAVLALCWAALYFHFDETSAASIPLLYAICTLTAFTMRNRNGWFTWFGRSQLTLILVLPFLLDLSLGGLASSGAVVLWSLSAPMGAVVFEGLRSARWWFIAFAVLIFAAAFLEPWLGGPNRLPEGLVLAFFVLNICGTAVVAFVLLQRFIGQKNHAYRLLDAESERAERLLLNVLPRDIADALKASPQTIADHYPDVTVLFADVVGFTALSAQTPPRQMVDWLNETFSHFDALASKYGLEKIRTIGDNYMVAAGVPRPRPDHAHAMAQMALDMRAYQMAGTGPPLRLRIGMSSGPVVGGVIGQLKFTFDIWGDAVNTASRMESSGIPGEIQISEATYELIRDRFDCVARGEVEVKSKGTMRTWLLRGRVSGEAS